MDSTLIIFLSGPKDVNAEQNGNLQPVEVQNKIRNIIEKCKSEQQTLAELANENLKFLEEICNKYKPQPEPFEPSPPLQPAEPTTTFLEGEAKKKMFCSKLGSSSYYIRNFLGPFMTDLPTHLRFTS